MKCTKIASLVCLYNALFKKILEIIYEAMSEISKLRGNDITKKKKKNLLKDRARDVFVHDLVLSFQ